MEFVKKNIKWIVLGTCALTIIGLFLPFATVSIEFFGQKASESVSFIEGDGALVFAAIVVAGVLLFLKKEKFSLIPLGIGVAITLYDAFNGMSEIKEITSIYSDAKLVYGFGFYLILIGLAAAIGLVCYNEFVLKKNISNMAMGYNNYNSNMQVPNQGYQQYGYNQNYQQSMQNGYNQQQPMMQNNYNNDFNINNNTVPPQGVMPTANVDTNIFNQAPVAQTNVPVAPQSQAVENNIQQQESVQGYPSPATVICPQCRATLNNGMTFCTQCGSKLN